jgi:hypothetical protein
VNTSRVAYEQWNRSHRRLRPVHSYRPGILGREGDVVARWRTTSQIQRS